MPTIARDAARRAALLLIAISLTAVAAPTPRHAFGQQIKVAQAGTDERNAGVQKSEPGGPDKGGSASFVETIKRDWLGLVDFAEAHDKAFVVIGTAFTAVFTVILACTMLFLWFATRRLARGTADTARRQLRAYVVIESGGVTNATVNNSPGFRVSIKLKNSGLTPAYSLTTWIMPPEILPLDALPFTPPRPLSERAGASIIGPGSDAWIHWFAQFGPDDVTEIKARNRAIFIWGGVNYTDAFKVARFFTFKIRVTGQEGTGGWGLSPHPLGYDAN